MAYTVGLLDSDVGYGQALMEYINMRAKVPIRLSFFSDPERLREYLRTNSMSLLLVGEAWRQIEADCRVLVLTEQREKVEREDVIFRYQNVNQVLTEILKYLHLEEVHKGDTPRFFAVLSPVKRCGKSTLSKLLCDHLGNCLYVDWQGFSSETGDSELGARFLYCMKSRNEEMGNVLERIITHDCMQVPSSRDYRDLRQLDQEDLGWFREFLKRRGDGICAVFDVEDTVLHDLNILREFDQIYMPYLESDMSKKKVENWKGFITAEIGETILPKLHMFDVTNRDMKSVAMEIATNKLF